jgi:GTP-binding protein LepA
MIDQSKIRNFCIIAHIDHGKSTLADRIIEMTGTLTEREMQSQVLDNMELERERGITIKSQAVRIVYKAKDGEEYIFNLIDTPGHVDFNYEVSRSLAACDGAILVVDAAQGVEAQTLANVYLALDHDLDVFPVINKIDLPSAEPDRVKEEIEDVIGIEADDAPLISAKTGLNIGEVLEQIVKKIPAPEGDPKEPLKALIFDSVYDAYKGVIVFCRIKEGSVKKGTTIRMMATGAQADVVEVGYFGAGQFIPCEELSAGMVGYITASLKNVKDTRVGDTITDAARPCAEPLPGYKKVNPMVYCGLYPADGAKYPQGASRQERPGDRDYRPEQDRRILHLCPQVRPDDEVRGHERGRLRKCSGFCPEDSRRRNLYRRFRASRREHRQDYRLSGQGNRPLQQPEDDKQEKEHQERTAGVVAGEI